MSVHLVGSTGHTAHPTPEGHTWLLPSFSLCLFNVLSVPIWLTSLPSFCISSSSPLVFLLLSIIVRNSNSGGSSSGSISTLHNKGFFVGIQGPFWLVRLVARSLLWWHPEMTRMDSSVTLNDPQQDWWIDRVTAEKKKNTNRLRGLHKQMERRHRQADWKINW